MSVKTGEKYTVPTQVRIGHIHLKVSSIERSLEFYSGLLGFEITSRYGESAVFISAGGYHHHIGLNTWESENGGPPGRGTTGLYHLAILYPTREDLAQVYKQLLLANYPISGASDHGVSEAIYLEDPDQNGIELYWDRDKEQWPTNSDGSLKMYTRPLDLSALLGLVD